MILKSIRYILLAMLMGVHFSFADWELETIPAQMTKIKPARVNILQSCENNTMAIPDGWDLVACVDKDSFLTPFDYGYTLNILNPNRPRKVLVNDSSNIAYDQTNTFYSVSSEFYPYSSTHFFYDPGISDVLDTDDSVSINTILIEYGNQDVYERLSIRFRLNGAESIDDSIYLSPTGLGYEHSQYYAHSNNSTLTNIERIEHYPIQNGALVMVLTKCNQVLYDQLYDEFNAVTDQLNQVVIDLYNFYLENGYYPEPPIYGEEEMDYFLWYYQTEENFLQQRDGLDQYLNQLRDQIEELGCGELSYS